MELSIEDKWKRSRIALAMLLGSSIRAIKNKYGAEGLQVIADEWEQDNIKTAGRQLKMAGIEETGLTAVVKLIDFFDTIYGVEGEWIEVTPRRAVKIEKSCPQAKMFPAETCTQCFMAAIAGVARTVTGNQDIACTMPKCLAGGDDCCEIIIEVGGQKGRCLHR